MELIDQILDLLDRDPSGSTLPKELSGHALAPEAWSRIRELEAVNHNLRQPAEDQLRNMLRITRSTVLVFLGFRQESRACAVEVADAVEQQIARSVGLDLTKGA